MGGVKGNGHGDRSRPFQGSDPRTQIARDRLEIAGSVNSGERGLDFERAVSQHRNGFELPVRSEPGQVGFLKFNFPGAGVFVGHRYKLGAQRREPPIAAT